MIDKVQGLNFNNGQKVASASSSPSTSSAVKANHGGQRNGKTLQNEQVNSQKVFKDLTKKLEELKKVVKTSFKYEILKNPDMIVLKVVNDENGEVVRQIPPKEAVKLAKAIDELLGLFVDKHV